MRNKRYEWLIEYIDRARKKIRPVNSIFEKVYKSRWKQRLIEKCSEKHASKIQKYIEWARGQFNFCSNKSDSAQLDLFAIAFSVLKQSALNIKVVCASDSVLLIVLCLGYFPSRILLNWTSLRSHSVFSNRVHWLSKLHTRSVIANSIVCGVGVFVWSWRFSQGNFIRRRVVLSFWNFAIMFLKQWSITMQKFKLQRNQEVSSWIP